MIAVDTSALVAIVLNEPERDVFVTIIRDSGQALISTVAVVETKMVLFGRRGTRAVVMVEDFLSLRRFMITPPGHADMNAAFDAFLLYGKGSGHRAALNFGDVFSYALAKTRNLPLLYKGNDFAETDLRSAVPMAPG